MADVSNPQTTPNPGSDEAIAKGCTCPVLDNHRGTGLPNGQFWISGDCQIHARPKFEEKTDD